MALQSLDQEIPSYTSAVRKFTGGECMSVLPMMDLANAYAMGLGMSLVVVAAVLDSVYASSLPGIP